MKNEKTSKRVATIAAKIMRQVPKDGLITVNFSHHQYGPAVVHFKDLAWADIRTVAASCLTQTSDKQPGGFDPREGGELEGRWRPKSAQVRKALRGKLGSKS